MEKIPLGAYRFFRRGSAKIKNNGVGKKYLGYKKSDKTGLVERFQKDPLKKVKQKEEKFERNF